MQAPYGIIYKALKLQTILPHSHNSAFSFYIKKKYFHMKKENLSHKQENLPKFTFSENSKFLN